MKKYLNVTFILVTAFLLFLAFDFQETSEEGINFGSAEFIDTTSAYISLNKGLRVNGTFLTKSGMDIVSGGSIEIPDGEYLNMGSSSYQDAVGLQGQINQMFYSANAHNFQGTGGGSLLTIDSSTSTTTVSTFTKLGASAPAIKMIQLTGVLPAVNNFLFINHGLSNVSKVLTINWTIRDDSLNRILPPGYNASTGLTTGSISYLSATQFSYYVPTNSVNLPGDTIRALITYIQ